MRANLPPAAWGPSAWLFLQNCLHAYDDQSRAAYLQLLRLLPEVLPCEACREHCRAYLRDAPPELRQDLQAWLADFRADVAARTRPRPFFSAALVLVLLLAIALVAALLAFTQR
jgi:hypothetical protein